MKTLLFALLAVFGGMTFGQTDVVSEREQDSTSILRERGKGINVLRSSIPAVGAPDVVRFSKAAKIAYATTSMVTTVTCEALAQLGTDPDPDVRLAAALNYYTPYSILRQLAKDDDEKIQTAASENLRYDRCPLWPGREYEPWVFRYDELQSVIEERTRKEREAANSLTGLRLRTYRTPAEAKSDLDRILSRWDDRPKATFIALTNAVDQIVAAYRKGESAEEAQSFIGDALVRTMLLPIPTNRVRSVQCDYAHLRNRMQDETFHNGWVFPPPAIATKLADLCGKARERLAAIERLRDEWKEKEPPASGGREALRTHQIWQDRMWFLEDRCNWALGDVQALHDWLFARFPETWYSKGLADLTPKKRLDAYRSLLQRSGVKDLAYAILSHRAETLYDIETHARERELAADAARRAWLRSLAPGAPGSGWPGRLEPFAADEELKEQLIRYGMTAGQFIRDPVEGLGTRLETDKIDSTIPYLHFAPKTRTAAPVVLYFGGTGELGTDLKVQFRQPAVFRELCSEAFQKRHPCHIVAPLCPAGSNALGPRSDLADLLFDCLYALAREARPPMDTNRLYITGLSWGGSSAFHLPWAYPGRFAAGVPVSAAPTARAVSTNAPCSFWALFNEGEPHREAIEIRMRDAKEVIEAHGGELRWSTFPDAGHDAWTKAWAEPAVWDWCFSKTADGRPVPGARTPATTVEATSVQTSRLAATSPGTPGHEPERASDGLAATWYEGGSPADTGDVLETVFPEPRSGRLRVELRGREAERPRCHVETSADGRIWTRVGTTSRKTGAFAATLTTPVVRVRIVVDTPSPHPLRVTTLLVEQRP